MTFPGSRLTFSSPAARRIYERGLAFQASKCPPEPARLDAIILDGVREARELFACEGSPIGPVEPAKLTARQIIAEAMALFRVERGSLLGRARTVKSVMARKWCSIRMLDELGLSTTVAGRLLGGRDHTTVMHAVTPKSRAALSEYLAKMPTERAPVGNAVFPSEMAHSLGFRESSHDNRPVHNQQGAS